MRSLRNLAICSVLPLLLASAVWAALPPAGYGGWKFTNGTRWDASTQRAGKPGWYAVPDNLKDIDSALLILDGVTPRLKTQGELDQEAADAAAAADVSQKTSRLAEFIAARAQLASLEAALAEMNGAKVLTRINARIATAQTRRDTAYAALADLP